MEDANAHPISSNKMESAKHVQHSFQIVKNAKVLINVLNVMTPFGTHLKMEDVFSSQIFVVIAIMLQI